VHSACSHARQLMVQQQHVISSMPVVQHYVGIHDRWVMRGGCVRQRSRRAFVAWGPLGTRRLC
jgi:hypothetical protein